MHLIIEKGTLLSLYIVVKDAAKGRRLIIETLLSIEKVGANKASSQKDR